MAKRPSTLPDVFDDFESSAERLADWVRRHAVGLGIGLVLAIAGVWGVNAWIGLGERRESEASAALAAARADYLLAMGAPQGSLEVPELANPEAARSIRAEYAARFRQVAEDHAGTVSGTLARLEGLELEAESLDTDARLAALNQALEEVGGREILRAMVRQRIAQVQEEAGRLAEAAASYEAAASIRDYPLRNFAMADAARCFASAGEPQRALALYDQLEAEAPDFQLPEHHRVLRRELRGRAAG